LCLLKEKVLIWWCFCDHQINNFGGAVQDASRSSKEDERGTALATRARLGDYDEGVYVPARIQETHL
jgi:hypothetical protein